MKSRKEVLVDIRDDNLYTLLARELDLTYHKEILIPRHKKVKNKRERAKRLGNDQAQIGNIEILIKDLNGIIGIIDKKLDKKLKELKGAEA